MSTKTWNGTPPKKCDVCSDEITNCFIDGKTNRGPWACMCEHCHKTIGRGLGTGAGQLYRRDENNIWVKQAG